MNDSCILFNRGYGYILTVILLLFCLHGWSRQEVYIKGLTMDMHGAGHCKLKPVALGINLLYRKKGSYVLNRSVDDGSFIFEKIDDTIVSLKLNDGTKWKAYDPDVLIYPILSSANYQRTMKVTVYNPVVADRYDRLLRSAAYKLSYQHLETARDTLHIVHAQSIAGYCRKLISLKDLQVSENLNSAYLAASMATPISMTITRPITRRLKITKYCRLAQ